MNIDNNDINVNKKTLQTLIRVVHNRENPFVQLNKKPLWDENLSLKAIGLWARCMSRPDNWTFNIKELSSKCKEGRDSIESAMKELIKYGYAYRFYWYSKNEQGQFKKGSSGTQYIFFEFSATPEEIEEQREVFKKSLRRLGFQEPGFQDTGFQDTGNPELLIKKETKIDVKEINNMSQHSLRLANFLFSSILQMNPKKKKPKLDAWAADIDKLMSIDGYTEKEVESVIKWVFEDPFWCKNILSGKKLREKYEQLVMAKAADSKQPKYGGSTVDRRTKNVDGTPVDSPADGLF